MVEKGTGHPTCFISALAWDTQASDNIINYLFFLEAQESVLQYAKAYY